MNDTPAARQRANLYVPMDINFDDHPAILNASLEAEAVYQRAIRFSKRVMSNGKISTAQARKITYDIDAGISVFDELVTLRLCSVIDEGWLILGYLDHNPSREQIEAKQDADRERKAAWRNKQRATEGPQGRDADATRDTSSPRRDATDNRDRDISDSYTETKTETETITEGLPPVTEGQPGTSSPEGIGILSYNFAKSYKDAHAEQPPPPSWRKRLAQQLPDHALIPFEDMLLIVRWMGKDGKDPKHLPLVVSDFYKDRQAGAV